jgi:hypothetical protein
METAYEMALEHIPYSEVSVEALISNLFFIKPYLGQ